MSSRRPVAVRYEFARPDFLDVLNKLDIMLNGDGKADDNRQCKYRIEPTGDEIIIARDPDKIRDVIGTIDAVPGMEGPRRFLLYLYFRALAPAIDRTLESYIVKRSPPLPQDRMPEQSTKEKPRVGA